MVKILIDIKLWFWDNVQKYNGKQLMKIKLGFWDNVLKYNGKKLLEIKLGFWDMNACCQPRFFKFNTVELVLFIAPM